MFLRKRCSGGNPFTKQSAELINRFSLPWIGTSCFDLSKLEHASLEYPISWRASVFTAKQKTQTLSEVVGEREKALLMAREHPAGRNLNRVQRLQDSYRLRSSLCAALLKCGIRY